MKWHGLEMAGQWVAAWPAAKPHSLPELLPSLLLPLSLLPPLEAPRRRELLFLCRDDFFSRRSFLGFFSCRRFFSCRGSTHHHEGHLESG